MTGLGRMGLALFCVVLAGCTDSSPDLVPVPGASQPELSKSGEGSGPLAGGKADARQLLAEAKRSAGMGNMGGAITLLEEVVKIEPDNRDALLMLAAAEQDRGQSAERAKSIQPMLRSADLMRKLRARFKDLSEPELHLLRLALFNEAIALANDGKPEKALASLEEAVETGFMGLDLLKHDEGLNPIRKDPKVQDLIKKVETAAMAQVKTRVKALFEKTKPFNFDFRLPDLNDKMVSSSDYRGKVLVVDFWGTWCPPCRREIPHFIELLKAHQAAGLEIVGVNYEQVEPEQVKPTVAAFVKENKIPYPCLVGDEKTQTGLGGFDGYPTTLFIDRTGKVRAKLVGLFDLDDSISQLGLAEIISTLLAEPAPTSADAS